MNIKGISKAEILKTLYNGSKPQGMGFPHAAPEDMTTEQAEKLLKHNPTMNFDYLYGRVMKINLSGDDLFTALYNRDIGTEAAENLLEDLLTTP